MSGDPEQEYFADGVVEEIITALSRFRQLFVIARNSTFTYKGRVVDVKQVGRELGVRYEAMLARWQARYAEPKWGTP
jgi:adenylate cyclase